jgi:NAD-dependent dihydropyrimidine dehydrogenase PreA subunit
MSRQRLTVVLSQAQGKHPVKRALEESIVAALILEPGVEVSVIPYLYDLGPDHTGRLFLEGVSGDMVVLAWMFPRAAFWVLDRDGIRGHWAESQLKPLAEDEDEETAAEEQEQSQPRGIGSMNVPDRRIYCLDLRDFNNFEVYVQEIRRIAEECRQQRTGNAEPVLVPLGVNLGTTAKPAYRTEQLLEQPANRRWYPVIDYSRCTNCMECIDFCLFGVYGVDNLDRILVENQDNCKKGCPACSRVCPEHAIMFPDYKTAAIAGAPVGAISGLKIDLSRLFGGGDAMQMAAAERDRELVADGRDAVGMTVGIPKRQTNKVQGPKDDLDKLMDSLDALDI